MNKRPLCQANENTCINLAELKGKKRDGSQKYGRLCDSHRRKGHDLKAFRNPDSVRYLPLNKCGMCNEKATDRHRIIPRSAYTPEAVVQLCKDCHTKIHRFYGEIAKRNYAVSPTK